jgi:sugar/nucleoside kinase (ribokinase family)
MSGPAPLDVIGIGNAIVDVIAQADEPFLAAHGMVKGSMALIDEARAELLYEAMGPAIESSGGSAGNTIAGIASLGGAGGYIGKVKSDVLGRVYRHDISAAGIAFPTPDAASGPATARCLIFVTPDAQRTMNTFLGASVNLGPEDIDPAFIASAKVTYLEGYLFDPPQAQEAFRTAARMAHAAGRQVSLSLSDSFCVHRHHAAFMDLVENHVDVLFTNESELKALFETDDLDVAVAHIRERTNLVAITRGKLGSVVVTADETIEIPAPHVETIVDTTGAGDLYAAGFLYGLTHGAPYAECGRLGSLAAGEILGHFGGRPQSSLKEVVSVA